MSKTTLTQIIHEALEAREYEFRLDNSMTAGSFSIERAKEDHQIALNALEERLNELIDNRVATALMIHLNPHGLQ